MTNEQLVMLVIVAIVAVLMRQAYKWIEDGGMYYRRYPGAKLMDELGKTGSLDRAKMDQIIQRVGNADDQHAEVAKLRQEMKIQ